MTYPELQSTRAARRGYRLEARVSVFNAAFTSNPISKLGRLYARHRGVTSSLALLATLCPAQTAGSEPEKLHPEILTELPRVLRLGLGRGELFKKAFDKHLSLAGDTGKGREPW